MIVPLGEGYDRRNEGLNEGLKTLLVAIRSNQGNKVKNLMKLLNNRPIKTIERQIRELVLRKFIERKGSKKTGGYFVAELLKR